ncbi:MAG: hypothetical protein BroJett011_43070 [Chloroflexota bacterium]|nr:MAG: hypothetical protein BroJett011_43070 [Chloroflexota bacterium]
MSLNTQELIKQTNQAASKLLKEKGYISVVEVLLEIGKLSKADYENWRFQRVPYLEQVITLNLGKINVILRTLQKNAQNGNLKASHTVYTSWGKGPRQLLRFSKSGSPDLEQAYSTHFVKRKENGE